MFGFDISIISGAVPYIQPYFGWSELQLGWGVSSLLVGAVVGAFGSGAFTDRFGRKKILIIVPCSLLFPVLLLHLPERLLVSFLHVFLVVWP